MIGNLNLAIAHTLSTVTILVTALSESVNVYSYHSFGYSLILCIVIAQLTEIHNCDFSCSQILILFSSLVCNCTVRQNTNHVIDIATHPNVVCKLENLRVNGTL